MTAERHLEGVDPYDLMDAEMRRLMTLVARFPDHDGWWSQPSRCEGWSARDVLAHLAANEDYHRACREGTVAQQMQAAFEAGVTGGDDWNRLGIEKRAGVVPSALLASWQAELTETIEALRERDGGEIDSSAGPYPVRLQAAHIAIEIATHADDMIIDAFDDQSRWVWRAGISRFLLEEHDDSLRAEAVPGGTHVTGGGIDTTLDDRTFTEAVMGRHEGAPLPPEVATALDVTH
jgi:uncharacterized protein (TIGR03083 family)